MQGLSLSKDGIEQVQFRACPDRDYKYLEDALFVIDFAVSKGKQEGGGFSFAPAELNRTNRFKDVKKMDTVLNGLELMGIISEPVQQPSTGGRPKLLTFLHHDFVPSEERPAEVIEKNLIARFIGTFRNSQPYIINDPEVCASMEKEYLSEQSTIPTLLPDFLIEKPADEGKSDNMQSKSFDFTVIREGWQSTHMAPPVKALYDFQVSYGGRVLSFKKGHQITEPTVAKFLLDHNQPVILAGEPVTMQYCPKCNTPKAMSGNKFHLKEDGIYLKPLVDFMLTNNGYLLRANTSQILTDPLINRWILQMPESCPVVEVKENVDFFVCENSGCLHAFHIDQFLLDGRL